MTKMSCGKRRYTSKSQAVQAMAARGLAAGEKIPVLRVYECARCHGFHLTSKPYLTKSQRRARKRRAMIRS